MFILLNGNHLGYVLLSNTRLMPSVFFQLHSVFFAYFPTMVEPCILGCKFYSVLSNLTSHPKFSPLSSQSLNVSDGSISIAGNLLRCLNLI